MDFPTPRPFGGRPKWGEVTGNLVLAALGALLAAGAFVALPGDVVAMRVLVWYTVAAVVVTLALAVALVATTRLPGLRTTRLDGSPAVVVRSWCGEWWHATALDAGLVVLAGGLTVLGLRADDAWLLASVLVASAGAWFLVRVVLTLAGRRRNEGFWLTPTDVGHDAAWGRETVRRDQVTRVSSVRGTAYLLLQVEGPVRRVLCPRAWRPAGRAAGRTDDGRIVVDCTWLGPDVEDLAAWLRGELGLEA